MDKVISPYYNDLQLVKLPDLLPLKGKSILVTGATGLVGAALTDLLMLYANKYEYNVYAGCRSERSFSVRFPKVSERLHFFQLDVTRPVSSNITIDYIVHAASGASPSVFATDPVGVMKANLNGVCNLLDYGIEHGLRRFLYISSGEAYGVGCHNKWVESDSGYVNTMSMRACYPSSKRAAETLCVAYAYQYGIDTMVARLCHTYGPYFTDKDNRVYAQFIRNVLNGEDIILKSKGEQFRSWIYVVDCVSALLYILLKGKSQEAYNVANNESNITIKQLAEIIAGFTFKKVVYDLPSDLEKTGSTPIIKAVFDTTKVESLGWKPLTGIELGLKHTIKSKE